MSDIVRRFSFRLLHRLQRRTSPAPEVKDEAEAEGETKAESPPEEGVMEEDGQLPQEEMLQTVYLPQEITLPADKAQILQHLELRFALTVRVPDLLDEYVYLAS